MNTILNALPAVLVVLSYVCAALLNLAVLRDKYIFETRVMAHGRRLFIGGLLVVAFRQARLLCMFGTSLLTFEEMVGLLLLAAGTSVVAVDRLQRRWGAMPDERRGERRTGVDRRHDPSRPNPKDQRRGVDRRLPPHQDSDSSAPA